ncbi:MAG: hypothetical protein M0033_02625 [Nitrospiraceae bacterium]|nr:hypothetical protein [Nitrospiraceae bacterium]
MAEVKITVTAENQTGSAFSAVEQGAKSAFEGIETSAQNASSMMQSAFDSLKSHWLEAAGTDFSKELENPALDAGNSFTEALADGIKSAAEVPYEAVESVVAKIRNLLPFSAAEEGPLSDLDNTGPAFINTIAEGITNSSGALQSAVQNAFDVIPACIDQTMGQAGSLVQQDMANISASIDEGMGNAASAVAQTSSSVADSSFPMADSLDNAASDMRDNFQSLSQAAASVDSDFSSLENDVNTDYLTDASNMEDGWGSSGSYSRSSRRKTGRSKSALSGFGSSLSSGSGLSSDLISQYSQAESNLALAEQAHPDVAYSADFVDSLRSSYQAQVNAYQEAMGINTLYGGSVSGGGSGSSGGVNVTINGITIQGATNIDGVDGLAAQLENAIAQNIQRNASPITTALKEAGI